MASRKRKLDESEVPCGSSGSTSLPSQAALLSSSVPLPEISPPLPSEHDELALPSQHFLSEPFTDFLSSPHPSHSHPQHQPESHAPSSSSSFPSFDPHHPPLAPSSSSVTAGRNHCKKHLLVTKLQRQRSECQQGHLIGNSHAHDLDYQRILITETSEETESDTVSACQSLHHCMSLRKKWIADLDAVSIPSRESLAPSIMTIEEGVSEEDFDLPSVSYNVLHRQPSVATGEYSFQMKNGVIHIFDIDSDERIFPVRSFGDFVHDYLIVRESIFSGPTRSYSQKHLNLLQSLYQLHTLLNSSREAQVVRLNGGRDFTNVRKVDTHIHHSACMTQQHLVKFMKHKLRTSADEIVLQKNGCDVSLGEVFRQLGLTEYDISLGTLDMNANNTFQRFDRFNLKYNPAGQSMLREIFLKTDNFLQGKYLAEITKEVFEDIEKNDKYTHLELRLSIYGRDKTEWNKLSQWFYVNELAHENIRWMIQIPRLYDTYMKASAATGETSGIKCFQDLLENIFTPLFEVTLNPSCNLPLHFFLESIRGFDCVDDESKPEFGNLNSKHSSDALPSPEQWSRAENPPYGYWLYYLYANIATLNHLRTSRGMSIFQFRPHCGEAGDVDHLISAYLLAHEINHGIVLNHPSAAALHYLYYLSQVGIAMSPLSNNRLFLSYHQNPFLLYFQQGLNVSLSTDDPLLLHCTQHPLHEEYAVATQVYNLTTTDVCELARMSVLQSGLEEEYKQYYLGEDYCNFRRTNVPMIRIRFREETLQTMIEKVERRASSERYRASMS